MALSIVAIPIVITVAALCIALPIIIGTYVYRDAKQRGMNPTLWTLLAVLAPGFIGFIIYLIVRNENSNLHCPTCGKNVRYNFSVCPYCGASLKAKCEKCGFVLEPGWETCPNCAEPIPAEQRVAPMQKQRTDKGLRRILIIAIVVPVMLCAVLITSIFFLRTSDSFSNNMVMRDISKSTITTSEVKEWIKQCDDNGTGAYALKYYDPTVNQTEMILYCNYPSEVESTVVSSSSSAFGKPTLTVTIDTSQSDDEDLSHDYLLCQISAYVSNDYKIEVCDSDGDQIDCEITDAQSLGLTDGIIGIDTETIDFDISLADNVKSVYEISWTLWSGDKPVSTDSMMNADGDYMDDTVSLSSSFLEENNIDSFSFELLGKNGKKIFESKKYKLSADEDYEVFGFNVGYNQNGKLDVISNYYE